MTFPLADCKRRDRRASREVKLGGDSRQSKGHVICHKCPGRTPLEIMIQGGVNHPCSDNQNATANGDNARLPNHFPMQPHQKQEEDEESVVVETEKGDSGANADSHLSQNEDNSVEEDMSEEEEIKCSPLEDKQFGQNIQIKRSRLSRGFVYYIY